MTSQEKITKTLKEIHAVARQLRHALFRATWQSGPCVADAIPNEIEYYTNLGDDFEHLRMAYAELEAAGDLFKTSSALEPMQNILDDLNKPEDAEIKRELRHLIQVIHKQKIGELLLENG